MLLSFSRSVVLLSEQRVEGRLPYVNNCKFFHFTIIGNRDYTAMYANREQEIKALRSKTIKIQLLSLPGAILLGLALYGIFAADGDAFHPALNSATVVYTLLALGIIIEIWQFVTVIPLLKKQAELQRVDD